jgi:hypothetical protein
MRDDPLPKDTAESNKEAFREMWSIGNHKPKMDIGTAIIEDAEAILALQRLAYQSEAVIYDDFTLPPLTESLEDLKARFHDRRFLKGIPPANSFNGRDNQPAFR